MELIPYIPSSYQNIYAFLIIPSIFCAQFILTKKKFWCVSVRDLSFFAMLANSRNAVKVVKFMWEKY